MCHINISVIPVRFIQLAFYWLYVKDRRFLESVPKILTSTVQSQDQKIKKNEI